MITKKLITIRQYYYAKVQMPICLMKLKRLNEVYERRLWVPVGVSVV